MRIKNNGVSRSEIESIRERVRLEDVIAAELGQAPDENGKVLCPFHDEKTPSFQIYEDQHYFCFGCEATGGVFDFVMKKRGIKFAQAVEIVGEISRSLPPADAPLPAPEVVSIINDERRIEILGMTADFYAKSLSSTAAAYLVSRGLNEETIRSFRLGYGAPGLTEHLTTLGVSEAEGLAAHVLKAGKNGSYEAFSGRIVIPYLRLGKVVYLGGRLIGEVAEKEKKYLNLKDAKPGFFNEDVLDRKDIAEVWVVEGAFDCLVAAQAGLPCVGVGGKSLKKEWIERLPKELSVKICFDDDAAGRDGAEKTATLLAESGRRGVIVHLPDGKDPDEYVLAQSVDGLRRLGDRGTTFAPKPKKMADIDGEEGSPELTSFVDLGNNGLAELLYDAESRTTQLAHYHNKTVEYTQEIVLSSGRVIRPFGPNSMMERKALRLPSRAQEYSSDEQLLADVQSFIARFVCVSEFYEAVAAHYVLLTWVFDCFPVVPYLRVRGDFGTGKTRFQEVLGALTYKTLACGGATTVAPLFRLIDRYRGTIIMDEADFRFSDAQADMIKILNCGYKRGGYVFRCVGDDFEPTAFDVYGPKILGTRGSFEDKALESRCLTEEMDGRYREGIPKHLPPSFESEALRLRNQLLLWRFRHYGQRDIDPGLEIPGIEPRLNEIALPILTVIESPAVRTALQQQFTEYNRLLIQERGMSKAGRVLEIISELYPRYQANGAPLTMKAIADNLTESDNPGARSAAANEYHRNRRPRPASDGGSEDAAKIEEIYTRKIAGKAWGPHSIGRIVGAELKLVKAKTRSGWAIVFSEENDRILERLRAKYGVEVEQTPSKPLGTAAPAVSGVVGYGEDEESL